MQKSNTYWMLTGLSLVFVLMLVFLGFLFYTALSDNLITTRTHELAKQTELAANEAQRRLNSLEEDLIYFTGVMEASSDAMIHSPANDIRTKRLLNTYAPIIKRLIIQHPGENGMIVYNLVNQDDFERIVVNDHMDFNPQTNFAVYGPNKQVRVSIHLNLQEYLSVHVRDYYIGPYGNKLLFNQNELLYLSDGGDGEVVFSAAILEQINQDIAAGLKGNYEGSFFQDGEKSQVIIAQYPFKVRQLNNQMAFIFTLEKSQIISGIYSAYFYLFGFLFLLLCIVLILLFKFSKQNATNNQMLSDASQELDRLFRQQTMLLQESNSFVYYLDQDGRYIRVSDNISSVLGYSQEEFIENVETIIKGERQEVDNEKSSQTDLPKKDNETFELDLIKKSGEVIRTKNFEKLYYTEEGEFSGRVGICTDIQDKYSAEKSLINSENTLRLVLDSLPDIIFIYDLTGVYIDYHVKEEILLLEPPQNSIGKTIMEVIPSPMNVVMMKAFERAVHTNRMQTEELELMLRSGKKTFEVRFIKLDHNKVMSLARDTTSQKLLENGLRESKDAAESASRAKSEFLANMSHEIRTPMNGLLGMIGLLSKTALNQQQKNYIQVIQDSGESLLTIIKDILDYSKIEAGKLELDLKIVNFRDQIYKIINIFSGLVNEKKIHLSLDIDNDTPRWLLLDRDKLFQILFNLVGNAVKFTPEEGDISVNIKAEAILNKNFMLYFTVKDNGIGIPLEKIPNLTEPFTQVDGSNTREYAGTGLGLAIAHKLIELMGGTLNIESAPGQGSCFSFTLFVTSAAEPIVDEVPSPSTSSLALPEEELKNLSNRYPLSILMAEDNEINIQFMNIIFGQMGYRPDLAKNGMEAVDKCRSKSYDLIFMDNQMPKMNGLEATKAIRKLPDGHRPVIIGLSANIFQEEIDKAYEAGMDDYLTKPINLNQISNKIKSSYLKNYPD
ncbi:PAS domain-containing hybrid sensor histidine kinase/response regulator [Anditalea andensis]|uniref:PAS domain-containing hybrid sensor histidine kinase/response regulator n=1 Tax=Anditalea andensis TaxID=1048983 RepID=UPI0013DEC529|nr:PAS domain-containing hybrid sensor histidine kinase/response regulator [Anditalea andensis]